VPENPRPPATIRINRPYGSEKEFVDGDFAWLGRTTIVLPNSPARQAGELIRFELVLTSGAPVFRGEGHVVAHHPPGGPKPPGLEVRFTRIDARSKLILDRVRERRIALSRPGERPNLSQAPSPIPTTSLQPEAGVAQAQTIGSPTEMEPLLPVLKPPVERASDVRPTGPRPKIEPPPNRDEILERLRARAKRLALAGGLAFKKR
jgi:hypothetical protein